MCLGSNDAGKKMELLSACYHLYINSDKAAQKKFDQEFIFFIFLPEMQKKGQFMCWDKRTYEQQQFIVKAIFNIDHFVITLKSVAAAIARIFKTNSGMANFR